LIESYDFGILVINGKKYRNDILVFPERILDNWWRKEGHELCIEDLREILSYEPKPEVIVVGTGYYGIMKIPPKMEQTLKSHGIELMAQPTTEACKTFNKLLKSGRRVVAAFHLTC